MTILLGSGEHLLTGLGGFRVLAQGVRISGQGTGTYIETENRSASAPVFDVQGNVLMRELDPASGVVTAPVYGVLLADFEIEGEPSKVPLLVRFREVMESRIEGIVARSNDSNAIVLRDSENIQIVGNTISDINDNGVIISGSSRHIDIVRNTISRTGKSALTVNGLGGITVIGNSLLSSAPSWIRIAENTVEDYGGVGIRVTRNGTSIPEHVQIVNNQVDGISTVLVGQAGSGKLKDGEGIAVSGNHIQIIGNRVDRAYVNRIAVFSKISLSVLEDIIIANNIISNSSQIPGAGNVHSAIALILLDGLGRDIVVSGNIGFDDQVTATQKFVVGLNPGTRTVPSTVMQNLYVEGNIAQGNISTNGLTPQVVCAAAQSGNLPDTAVPCVLFP